MADDVAVTVEREIQSQPKDKFEQDVNFQTTFHEFTSGTTLHGVVKIANSNTKIYRRYEIVIN